METTRPETFAVFTRAWWRNNPEYPNGLEPDASGPRRYLARRVQTEEEAQAIAQEYNRTHKPGRLSIKAEYETERTPSKRTPGARYVNRRQGRDLETVEECMNRREAARLAREYNTADPAACYYVSTRPTRDW